MGGAFLLLFMPLLVDLGRALVFSPQPLENRVFGAFATWFVAALVLGVAWKSFLFAVHVKQVNKINGELLIGRVLAPKLCVSNSRGLRSFSSAVPSLSAPYFKRGTVFRSGMSIFYVSDYLPNAQLLVDHFSAGHLT
jgi:hypothetical protein